MVTRVSKASSVTVGTISDSGFPKLFMKGPSIATKLSEQVTLVNSHQASDEVWESLDIVGGIELGRDFDTCVLSIPSRNSVVIRKKIPAPVLSLTQVNASGNPVISWTNSFQVPSRVYRTPIYVTGSPVANFTLILQLAGATAAGTPLTYTDNTIDLEDETMSVSYFVENDNGTSNVLVATGPEE